MPPAPPCAVLWHTVVNLDCATTCSSAGKVAINGGTAGQALCGSTIDGVTYYGASCMLHAVARAQLSLRWVQPRECRQFRVATSPRTGRPAPHPQPRCPATLPVGQPTPHAGHWRQSDKKCHFVRNNNEWWWFTGGYSCACVKSSSAVSWEANSACAAAPRAAATDPPVCRYSKYQSTSTYTIGYWKGNACYAIGEKFGPSGQTYAWVSVLGGSYNVQLLCTGEWHPRRPGRASRWDPATACAASSVALGGWKSQNTNTAAF